MSPASASVLPSARALETLVWTVASLLILATLGFASAATANATAAAAIFASLNFSLARFSLQRMLSPEPRRRLLYGFLYVLKLTLLLAALVLTASRLSLPLSGLLLGFSVLPLSLYMLLAWVLLRRLRKE
jgi:accessory gene regulator protein AgrB